MRKTGKIRDTRRTGKTGQIMDPTHFARAFFFFFCPAIGLFYTGVTGWHQLDLQGGFFHFLGKRGKHFQCYIKDINIKEKLKQVT